MKISLCIINSFIVFFEINGETLPLTATKGTKRGPRFPFLSLL